MIELFLHIQAHATSEGLIRNTQRGVTHIF
jgi:hypothetical protein